MYRVLAASLGALALIMLVQNAPATNQLFAAPGPVVVVAPQQVPAMRGARAGQPLMYGGIPPAMASLPAVETATSVLLAKSQADELLDEVFINFPLFFVGLIFGYAALETAKSQLDVELPEGSEGVVTAGACLGGAGFFLILGNSGILGAASGILAKALLDGWNIIASAVLKGALLKY